MRGIDARSELPSTFLATVCFDPPVSSTRDENSSEGNRKSEGRNRASPSQRALFL